MHDMTQHVVLAVVHVNAFHGHGDHLRAGSLYGLLHQLVGAEFARSHKKAGCEFFAAYYKVTHIVVW